MAIIKGYDYIRKADTYFETTTYYDHKTGVPTQEKISLGYIDKYTGEFVPIKRTHGDGSDVHRENQIIFGKDDDKRDALYYKNMYDFCRLRLEAKDEEIAKIVNKYNSFLFENGVFSDTFKELKATESRTRKQLEEVQKAKNEEAEKYDAKVKELQSEIGVLQKKIDGVYKSLGIKVDNIDKAKITEEDNSAFESQNIGKAYVPLETKRAKKEREVVGNYWFTKHIVENCGNKYIKETIHYRDPKTNKPKTKSRTIGRYNLDTKQITPTNPIFYTTSKKYYSREDLIKAVDAELAEARKEVVA